VHFVTGERFALPDFGSFPGLISDNLQQHEVLYLIVPASPQAGTRRCCSFASKPTPGKAFRAIRKDRLLAQSHGINVSAWKLCAPGRSIPALAIPARATEMACVGLGSWSTVV
jgi:hypothetical protein